MEDFLNEENAQETQQDNNFDDDFDFDGENTQQQPENEEEEFEGDNNEQQFDQQEEQAEEEEQGVVDQTNDDDQHDQFQQQDSYEPAYNYEEPAQTSKTTPIQYVVLFCQSSRNLLVKFSFCCLLCLLTYILFGAIILRIDYKLCCTCNNNTLVNKLENGDNKRTS